MHINDISLDIEYEIRFFVSDYDRYREIKDIEDTLNLEELLSVKAVGQKIGYEISNSQM